jgi:hypothetical protein
VDQLFAAIDSPVLVDVAVDWNSLPVVDAYPQRLPDLFAGQTINLVARYTKPANGTAYVTGRIGARRVRMAVRVNLPAAETAHEALGPTWARWKIADLSDALRNAAGTSDTNAIEKEITDVAMAHRLVSQYTSFVAVDESRIVSDGRPVRVMQPVELPEGVSYQGIFGEQPVGLPMRIGSWGADVQGTSSGVVKVGDLTADGAAERAGLRRGSTVKSVNGATVTTVAQLEAMLLQSSRTVVLETDKGRVELKAP